MMRKVKTAKEHPTAYEQDVTVEAVQRTQAIDQLAKSQPIIEFLYDVDVPSPRHSNAKICKRSCIKKTVSFLDSISRSTMKTQE